jgi:serine/threonine-protein kinase
LLLSQIKQMLDADETGNSLLDARDAAGGKDRATRVTACRSCGTGLAANHRFCPACGTPIAAPGEEGRFRAGALFAGRFRIAGALGRGGMGDVYRADDLELGHPVALKFLTAFRNDERARSRLRNEVRLARQVSHPNVCRVFDIGEAQGELYLSMEYVDGEDLAASLRRIGRVPIDKGLEIARKLCAGLAAAHAKGVLHRDFKPANIMIDARGEVRIMDFGLAALAERVEAADVRSGTPAYMSPEQLAGREATVRSDLYALGLVLYELFTGKAPFAARDVRELAQQRGSRPVTTPSTLIPDLDAKIERAILRCLEPNPEQRPATALEVSAALPGGDPLAEALAAGETPSPEMVAAAGETEGLRPRVAVALAISTAVCLGIVLMVTPRVMMLGYLPLQHPPEELRIRARDVVRIIGLTANPADFETAFEYEERHAAALAAIVPQSLDRRDEQWRTVLSRSPWPVHFAYRQADVPLIRIEDRTTGSIVGVTPVASEDARLIVVDVALDGRLLRLAAPPPRGVPPNSGAEPPWPSLFEAAGLDITRFESAQPSMDVAVADVRAAWTGRYPDAGETPVRIEAASLHGQPTFFAVLFPWSDSLQQTTQSRRGATTPFVTSVLLAVVYVGFALVARHNLKLGRGDTRGAWRVGAYFGIVLLARQLFGRVGDPREPLLVASIGPLAAGLTFALAYLAIEPWTRRLWPHMIITWSRLVAGRWRDPLVARDALTAVACVTASYALLRLVQLALVRAGEAPLPPAPEGFGIDLNQLLGGGVMVSAILRPLFGGPVVSLVLFFLMFIAFVLLRQKWLAAIAYIVLGTLAIFPATFQGAWMYVFQWLLEIGFLLILTLRFGLLAAAIFSGLSQMLSQAALTYRFDEWFGQSSLVASAIVAIIVLYGLRVSLAGRPLLGGLERVRS